MNRLCAGSPTVAHSADCLLLRRWQRHDVSSHGTTCSKLPATQHFPPRKSHIAVFSISETWGEDRNYTKVLHFPHLVGNKTNKQKLSYFNHSKIVVFAPMFLCQELIRNWGFFSFSFYFGILKLFPPEPVKKMTSEREGECDRSCPGTIFFARWRQAFVWCWEFRGQRFKSSKQASLSFF